MNTENNEGMSGLESLRGKLNSREMPSEDLHKLIAEVRDSRKRPKRHVKSPTTVKKGKKSSGKYSVDLEVIMESMTDDEKAAVISRMEGLQG